MTQEVTTRRFYAHRGAVRPTEWTVDNFKSLEHATLPLNHLSVLTGANSSGKSSLIQSLLLLAQSPDDEVILNGPLVRLGEATDVIRSGTDSITFSYSVLTQSPDDESDREWSFSLKLGSSRSTLEVKEFDAAVDGEHLLSATSSRVSRSIRAEVDPEQRYGNSLLRVREVAGLKAPPRTYVSFSGFYPEALIVRSKKESVLANLRRTYGRRALETNMERIFQLYEELRPWWHSNQQNLPADVIELYGTFFQRGVSPSQMRQEVETGVLDKLFYHYAEAAEKEGYRSIPVSRFYPALSGGRLYGSRTLFGASEELRKGLRGLGVADDGLKAIRESVRYLGPLREEPQVVSPSGGRNRSFPAGTKGEYTADLLARERNSDIAFFDWEKERRQLKLPDAVSLWANYLGVGDKVAVEDQGKLGRGLRLQVHGADRDLTMVGVGASQLLPVIAVVLAASARATVCVEQPELHLHPAVQSRLADFFLYARPDIALLIETHSEYMITRIRRRAAEKSISTDDVAVFFAEQHGGVTNLRNLKLSTEGGFSDWPAGFFDTQDEDARALVRAIADVSSEKRT